MIPQTVAVIPPSRPPPGGPGRAPAATGPRPRGRSPHSGQLMISPLSTSYSSISMSPRTRGRRPSRTPGSTPIITSIAARSRATTRPPTTVMSTCVFRMSAAAASRSGPAQHGEVRALPDRDRRRGPPPRRRRRPRRRRTSAAPPRRTTRSRGCQPPSGQPFASCRVTAACRPGTTAIALHRRVAPRGQPHARVEEGASRGTRPPRALAQAVGRPVHVARAVGRLHGRDHAQGTEARARRAARPPARARCGSASSAPPPPPKACW